MCQLFWNMGTSTSWNPQYLPRPVMGLLYQYLHTCYFMSGPHDGLIQSETCSHEKILILILILICLLTAIGLTPGSSSTVHTYAQIIHTRRTTQLTTLVGRLSGIRNQSGQTKINDELIGKNYRLMGRVRAVFDLRICLLHFIECTAQRYVLFIF
jgi:hypothetical protein